MVLDFTKGKYGLQLIILLFILLISGLIFQLLGVTIINSVFNFDFNILPAFDGQRGDSFMDAAEAVPTPVVEEPTSVVCQVNSQPVLTFADRAPISSTTS